MADLRDGGFLSETTSALPRRPLISPSLSHLQALSTASEAAIDRSNSAIRRAHGLLAGIRDDD